MTKITQLDGMPPIVQLAARQRFMTVAHRAVTALEKSVITPEACKVLKMERETGLEPATSSLGIREEVVNQ